MDRFRRVLVAVLVLVIAAAVVLVVTVRPGLRDDADQATTSWKPLVRPLDVRYEALRGVVTSLQGAGAGERSVTLRLDRLLDRWAIVRAGSDTDEQVTTANQIETLAARARALSDTPRMAENDALVLTVAAFEQSRPSAKVLTTYNNDVVEYQDRRDGPLSRIVARLDGYPMRPTLQLVS